VARAGLSADRVVEEAAAVADEVGLEALTLAAVAHRVGVRTPSLYKHVEGGLPQLRRLLGVRAKRRLTAVLAEAALGRSRGDALRALAQAYRRWASAHPADYAAAQRAPVAGDGEDERASTEVTRVVFGALAGYDADEDTLVDAVRTLRAGLHGFVALDAAGGFALPRSLDDSFAWWLTTLDAALSDGATRP
jgi:AcrR family transcriptional regulator